MINKTFCHVDGVSIDTEKKLWENGILTWEDFFEKIDGINFLPQSKIEKIKNEINYSKEMLNENNINYFRNKIPENQHWRFADFGKIAFVDIETTGLSRWSHDITMIGIYDGETPHIYTAEENLEDAYSHLDSFDIVVTFNGKQFDLPFIEYKAKKKYDLIHLDLRFLLKEFGLKGGLKSIERELGISRDDEVANVDGFEAVRLWRKYKGGDLDALRLLKKYNEEDIVNLKYLLEYYLKRRVENVF